ncbi:CYP4V2 [Mytilus edulis]|uniref:CYP4V2 n=1 Tax=Mytilus edulis TaxID=6550 RepID=A0A8S3RPW1_MYTED|nr:CYP4V2 [Mytilus edulis]
MVAALLLVGVATIVLAVIWYMQYGKLRKELNKFPGPPAVPVFGNALLLKTDRKEFYNQLQQWCEDYRESGIVRLWLFEGIPWVGIYKAEYCELQTFCEDYRQKGIFRLWLYEGLPLILVYKPEFCEILLNSSKHIDKASEYRFLHPWLGTGLLTSTGTKWKTRRRMLTPTFHFKILNDFMGVFNDQIDVMMNKLEGKWKNGSFNIFNDITLCALDIICETAMGRTINAQNDEDSDYVKAVYKITELILTRQRSPWYWPDFLFNTIGAGKEHDKLLKFYMVSQEREEFSKKQADGLTMEDILKNHDDDETSYISREKRLAFLDMLLCSTVEGESLSFLDIREEVDNVHGHDTTAAAMSFTMHLIGAHPEVQAKVHKELDEVFGDSNRRATMKDLKSLKYLECVIKEGLRLFPSVPFFGRTTTEDLVIDDVTIPQGTTCILVTFALHMDPKYFPNPEKFDPDRFLQENIKNRHPYCYVPFSAGPRNCIGQKFAMLEEKAMISSILRRYNVKATQKREEMCAIGEIIMRADNGVFVELSPR